MSEKVVEDMAKKIAVALKGSESEWEQALTPMKTDISSEKQKANFERLISHPKPSEQVDKKLEGFKTYTFLDSLYLKGVDNPLDGVPVVSQVGVTGLPSSGKSILIEEIAVRVAMHKKVLLVTSEDSWESPTPRFDLQARLKQKADLLSLDWDTLSKKLFVLDTVANTELREWRTFAETYRYVCGKEDIELVLVDSVTLLETYRGALKERLRELCRYNQLHGITALYVNQRATEDWDTRGMAGGIGLGHILDSTIIVDYGRVYHTNIKEDLGLKRGVDVKIVRVLGCRLCAFDGKYHEIMITKDGFLREVEKE